MIISMSLMTVGLLGIPLEKVAHHKRPPRGDPRREEGRRRRGVGREAIQLKTFWLEKWLEFLLEDANLIL